MLRVYGRCCIVVLPELMTVLYVTYITFYNNVYYHHYVRLFEVVKRNFGRERLTRAHVTTNREALDEASNKPASFHILA